MNQTASKDTPMGRVPLRDWQVQNLRLTAFLNSPIGVSFWDRLLGGPPEQVTESPRTKERQEVGAAFGEATLLFKSEPLRLDWILHEGKEALAVGPWETTLNTFADLMNRWFTLEDCPPVKRLAFGCILLAPASDRPNGYRLLQHYLPSVTIDPEASSDFFFQINRPRESTLGISGLRINRLSKWSVASLIMRQISIGLSGVTAAPLSPPLFGCRLELDINTVSDYQGTFERQQLPSLLQELTSLGQEIVIEGDIP